MSAHLLIVDDDDKIRSLVQHFLNEKGFDTKTACDASEAKDLLKIHTFDVIILDIMMPGEDGLSLTKSLRHRGVMTPILCLSARVSLNEKVEGLDAGADDYLTKPFDIEELIARINALLRRSNNHTVSPKKQHIFGGLTFDPQKKELKNGVDVIPLSSTEQYLLLTLSEKPMNAYSREELAQKSGFRISERSVDSQIKRLREKIGDNAKAPRFIKTIRHVGYALYPDNVT